MSDLIEDIKLNISELDIKISEYMLTFKQEDFFTFSNCNERKDEYEKEYFSFILDIKNIMDELTKNALSISERLLDADRNGDVEKIEFYNKIFEGYLSFRNVISEYNTLAENELSKDVPSVSLLFTSTKKLKMACSMFLSVL